MDITGKIIYETQPRGGVSQRSSTNWKAQDFVIETHEQYPKKCCFTVFGEERLKEFHITVGEELTVSVDIDAHEYNGRWYNDIRAWRVQRGVVAQPAPAPIEAVPGAQPIDPMAAPLDNSANGDPDDLPF